MKLLKMAVLGLTLVAASAQAQNLLTLRDSRTSFTYLYGCADQTFAGGREGFVGTTAASDVMHMESAVSDECIYLPNGNRWMTALQWNQDHSYSLQGGRRTTSAGSWPTARRR